MKINIWCWRDRKKRVEIYRHSYLNYRNNTLRYLMLVGSAVVLVILSSVFIDLAKGNLTYRTWMPFDYSSPAAFGIVYANQMIGMSTSALVNIACESLICGLLLNICCQFDILEYRLTRITRDRNALPNCIRHHNYIFKSVLSNIHLPASSLRFDFRMRRF